MKVAKLLTLVGIVVAKKKDSYAAERPENNVRRDALMVIPPGPAPRASLRQIFRDDFNTLDRNKWTPDASAAQGGHNEFEIYSPESHNCYTRGGLLYLQPTLTSDRFGDNFLHHGVLHVKKQWGYCNPTWNNGCNRDANKDGIMPPIMSCMLRSKTSFKYGKLEIVAQMPRGDWLWPALWLMPKHSHYGGWPRSGEIDIAETTGRHLIAYQITIPKFAPVIYRGFTFMTGNLNYGQLGVQRATASLHFGDSPSQDKQLSGQHFLHGTTYGHGMHKYVLDWTSSHINMYVDDILVYGIPTPPDGMHNHYGLAGSNIWGNSHNAPFDQDFYILMNVAVGGTQAMFFDWVRNYPHPMPWGYKDSSRVAMEKFWNHKNDWYSTWHGQDAAMKVDSVTIWSYE